MDKVIVLYKRGYRVSEDGILYNKNRVEVGSVQGRYHRIGIRINKKKVFINTHRLQAYQKYGDKLFENDIVVRHKNGNNLDNSWENILIGTQSDNMMDIPKQIRILHSIHASSFNKKYNKEEIKKFHKKSKSYKKTMEEFNISSKGTLNYILKN